MNIYDESLWDTESIKRYEKLLMFETEYPVKLLELVDCSNLCTLSEKETGAGRDVSVVTVYSLPPRLSVANPTQQVSLSPHFDLRITAGTFTKRYMTQIVCIRGKDYILGSQKQTDEIVVYRTNINESGRLVTSGVLRCEGLTHPNIAANSDVVLAATQSDQGISLIDIRSKAEIGRRCWNSTHGEEVMVVTLKPLMLSQQSFLVYSTSDGQARVYDTRQQHPTTTIQGGGGMVDGWTAGGSYEEGTNQGSLNLGFVSTLGACRFFSLKQPDSAYSQVNLGSTHNESSRGGNVSLNPLDESVASVSGLDSRVYILDVSTDLSTILFCHDGHEHTELSPGSDTVTTSHVWYSPGGPTSLISASHNTSINCWSYIL